jgi:hypothetical protein
MRVGTESAGRLGLGLLVVAGLAFGALGGYGYASRGQALSSTLATTGGSGHSRPAAHKLRTGPLLSSMPYAQYAFRIYPGPVSAAARAALAGFTVDTRVVGGQLRLRLGVPGNPPVVHRYPVSVRVYFVEANLGDDSNNYEYNLGDDGLVVTDSTGHILR